MNRLDLFKNFVGRFIEEKRGTTAIIFGIMIIPVMVLAGGVVDYGRAVKTKAQLAATLDAAVLATQMQYSLDDTTDYKQMVHNYVKKNLTEASKTYQGLEIKLVTRDITEESELIASISTKVTTNFLNLIGFNHFNVSVSSAAIVGGGGLELALVLDNTKSMNGDKLTALKAAAKDLTQSIMKNKADDTVKMAIVPFTNMVNIGVENRNEPGLDIPAPYTIDKGKRCDSRKTINTNCDYTHETYACTDDGMPATCTRSKRSNCEKVPNPNYKACWNSTTNYDWHGCMWSRPHDLNVRDEDYGLQGVPGYMTGSASCESSVKPITRLTANKGTVISSLNAMQAKGNTYIPTGLMWGWRALSSTTPFADGVPYTDESVRKVIILMTDGNNSRSMRLETGNETINHNGEIYSSNARDQSDANTITSELCANIQAKKIMIFTIAFEVPEGSEIEEIMKACAGNGGRYYDADNSVELANAFAQIGLSLLNLRLSR
ncbi:MAG: VWA domain-containing protein [bacterium]|nr:VWA domain-containing protein [bacterium]